jgi:hypothetical protein
LAALIVSVASVPALALAAGTYTFRVSGTCRASVTLTVTAPT